MATGKVLPLPVSGTITQVLCLANGTTLVRSGATGHLTLTLLSADLRVLASEPEPALLKDTGFRDYVS